MPNLTSYFAVEGRTARLVLEAGGGFLILERVSAPAAASRSRQSAGAAFCSGARVHQGGFGW